MCTYIEIHSWQFVLSVFSQRDISEGPPLMLNEAPTYFALPIVSHFTGWWTGPTGPTTWLQQSPCLNPCTFTVWVEATTYFITYLLSYLITYLLTPWSRVLLEKLTSFQLVKKFPSFYGTRNFITALTSAQHLSLSWASSIQSIYPHPTSWRSVLISSSYLRLCPKCDTKGE